MDPKAYRLPEHVRPTRYDVHLDARPGRPEFHGRVRIAIRGRDPLHTVELHARGLELRDVRATAGDATVEGLVRAHPEQETVTIVLPTILPAGDAVLDIAFAGRVSAGLSGLYVARDGPESCLATQCQSTDARAIFPCFDEPIFKARLAWTVTTDSGPTVLANGALESREESADGKSRTWRFAATPPIPVYLAALVIGELASTPESRERGVPLRVWSVRGKEHLGAFAHSLTQKLLPWYEDYFATPYPYGKYDQVAVPGFAAGAMENAGLVSFRQIYLLLNARTASWKQERQVARVVAHEFAHMWFGNLVTMRWWDDLWLNEAFAEWMAHKAVAAIEPRYRVWDLQIAARAGALTADALASSHSIYSPVSTPEQATELFDAITYDKGAAVMRMLERYLGEDAFRAGLRSYMMEFAEANAAGADLWRHLRAASREPVDRIMAAWITQAGHPVVSARLEIADRSAHLHLSQRRFFSDPRAAPSPETWPVPVVMRFEDDAGVRERRALLDAREVVVPLESRGSVKWLTANAGGVGVYRQDLDDVLLARLLDHRSALDAGEQVALLDDLWGLARAGARPLPRFLATLAAFAATKDHAVLDRVVDYLRTIEDMILETGDDVALFKYRTWCRRTFRADLDALGWDGRPGESPDDAARRAALADAVATLGRDGDAVRAAVRLAEREAADPTGVDPALAPVVVHLAAKLGDRRRFDWNVRVYEARRAMGASPQETERYLYSFIAFETPELVAAALRLMDANVLPQESHGPLLRAMLARRHAQSAAWEYVKANWSGLRSRLGDMWMGFLVEASGNLPLRHRADLLAFYDANLHGLAEQSRRRAIEALDQRVEFRNRVRTELLQWFRSRAT